VALLLREEEREGKRCGDGREGEQGAFPKK